MPAATTATTTMVAMTMMMMMVVEMVNGHIVITMDEEGVGAATPFSTIIITSIPPLYGRELAPKIVEHLNNFTRMQSTWKQNVKEEIVKWKKKAEKVGGGFCWFKWHPKFREGTLAIWTTIQIEVIHLASLSALKWIMYTYVVCICMYT